MALNDNTLVQTLINAGADAQSNLFTTTFILHSRASSIANVHEDTISYFSVRNTKFDAPKLGIKTTKVPYQNTDIEKIIPSSDINKTLSFDFRLDANFALYQKLKDTCAINELGDYDLKNALDWTIRVEALNPIQEFSNKSQNNIDIFEKNPVYVWVFENCKVIDIPTLPFSYNSSNPITIQVKFLWGKYTCGKSDSISMKSTMSFL